MASVPVNNGDSLQSGSSSPLSTPRPTAANAAWSAQDEPAVPTSNPWPDASADGIRKEDWTSEPQGTGRPDVPSIRLNQSENLIDTSSRIGGDTPLPRPDPARHQALHQASPYRPDGPWTSVASSNRASTHLYEIPSMTDGERRDLDDLMHRRGGMNSQGNVVRSGLPSAQPSNIIHRSTYSSQVGTEDIPLEPVIAGDQVHAAAPIPGPYNPNLQGPATRAHSEERIPRSWWEQWADLFRRRLLFILVPLTLILLGALIGLIVIYIRARDAAKSCQVSSPLPNLTTISQPMSGIIPIVQSGLGATATVFANIFRSSQQLEVKLVYNPGGGRLCLVTKTTDWSRNARCIEGANPKNNTPITILDWIGGPSIYYITAENTLGGLDHVPNTDSFKLSSVAAHKIQAHKSSPLTSVAWLNGTSSWLYYQDTSSQLREFGIDDYRNVAWRDGSTGPLGIAQNNTGVAAARYITPGGDEIMEVYYQATNGAIHGRVYNNSVWTSEIFSVDGTATTVTQGSSMSATTVKEANGTTILLAYVSSSGWLTLQSRGTANVTQYSKFTAPKPLMEGDGNMASGVATVDVDGKPKVYFVSAQKILEFSATSVVAENWAKAEINAG